MDPAAILGATAALATDPLRIAVVLAIGWFWAPRLLSLFAACAASVLIVFLFAPPNGRIIASATLAGGVIWAMGRGLRLLTHHPKE